VNSLFGKAAAVGFALTLSSAIALGLVAKQQYTKAVIAEQNVAALARTLEIVQNQLVANAKLVIRKQNDTKAVMHERNKLKADLRETPDDGCLDRRVPDAVLKLLR